MKNLLLFMVLVGCSTTPVTPQPPVEPEEKITCQMACNNFYYFGCPEGEKKNCVVVCEKAIDSKMSNYDLKCWATAIGKEAIRTCGGIECK